MTHNEMLDIVKEYQTTDSISRRTNLFDLIRQNILEVWFQIYAEARRLYLKNPLPTVSEILNDYAPVEKNLQRYKNSGYTYYAKIELPSPQNCRFRTYEDKIILTDLSEDGGKAGFPSSITVRFNMFNPDYLDYYIREIKTGMRYTLGRIICKKEDELEELKEASASMLSVIASKLKNAEPGTTLWFERWYDGRLISAKNVEFARVERNHIVVKIDGIEVPFDYNGTQDSENDYTSACMLFPSSDHKRWEDVTYVPSSKQKIIYEN